MSTDLVRADVPAGTALPATARDGRFGPAVDAALGAVGAGVDGADGSLAIGVDTVRSSGWPVRPIGTEIRTRVPRPGVLLIRVVPPSQLA